LASLVSLEVYVAVFITLQLTAQILNIKTTAIEVEKLWEISFRCHLLLIELLSTMRIDNMAILVSEPSFLIHRSALFVH
jgi:hypothetical protein